MYLKCSFRRVVKYREMKSEYIEGSGTSNCEVPYAHFGREQ